MVNRYSPGGGCACQCQLCARIWCDGAKLNHATIQLSNDTTTYGPCTTDASGQCCIDVPVSGTYTYSITQPAVLPSPVTGTLAISCVGGPTAYADIEVCAKYCIQVRGCYNPATSNTQVVGATLRYTLSPSGTVLTATTDSTGTACFIIPHGQSLAATLTVSATGYATFTGVVTYTFPLGFGVATVYLSPLAGKTCSCPSCCNCSGQTPPYTAGPALPSVLHASFKGATGTLATVIGGWAGTLTVPVEHAALGDCDLVCEATCCDPTAEVYVCCGGGTYIAPSSPDCPGGRTAGCYGAAKYAAGTVDIFVSVQCDLYGEDGGGFIVSWNLDATNFGFMHQGCPDGDGCQTLLGYIGTATYDPATLPAWCAYLNSILGIALAPCDGFDTPASGSQDVPGHFCPDGTINLSATVTAPSLCQAYHTECVLPGHSGFVWVSLPADLSGTLTITN